MPGLAKLALLSAWNRRYSLGLTMLAIALAVTLLLGIERIRHEVRDGFAQSVSGTDLIVGARSSPLQLVLYSVFRLGEATHNMSWPSAQRIAAHPAVAWTIPISLGDSHRGYPVVGTTPDYFVHFQHGDRQSLRLASGRPFGDLFETVIGAEVAAQLGYVQGDAITLSHGLGGTRLMEHAGKPFTVVGVLARTGTPVDRSVHINLASMEAIHLDWVGGAPLPGLEISADQVTRFDLEPKNITALLVGLESRAAVFRIQREINRDEEEALMAVLPGVALAQLWQLVGVAEQALLLISALVVVVSLVGLVAAMLTGLDQRRRELAILRSSGARPRDVFALLALEGGLVTLSGVLLGLVLLTALLVFGAPLVESRLGLGLELVAPGLRELRLLGLVLLVSMLTCLLPGWRAYRISLADGLTPRV
ncbi:ABC transporter permease [Wenzhouxiangella sp. XN24]|uniref:ABC transporter permease n=1 Tax=Wenzhouxiangella sp. XN24 TaxID=2713569 RepID=UPI0013E9D8C9|nr:ABC transporter permease [Wenzhouxiangella sp. XN24]NGX16842.1 ABC transporter permease [Wenzhouxiangella sp. XN24]